MDKTITTSVIVFVVALIIGYFIRPLIDKPDPITVTDVVYQDSGRPDSVWAEEMEEAKKYYIEVINDNQKLLSENLYLKARGPKLIRDTLLVESSAPDRIITEKDLEGMEFTSKKTFAWNKDMVSVNPDSTNLWLVKSQILAKAPLPVMNIDNEVTVRWQTYYEKNIQPQVQWEIEHSGNAGKLKGIAIGALAIAGLASQNEFLAVGGLAAAGGLYIFW